MSGPIDSQSLLTPLGNWGEIDPLPDALGVAPTISGLPHNGFIVTDVENFEAMADTEMKARVTSFTPAMASEFSIAWQQFSKSICTATEALHADINSADNSEFEGQLPDKVRDKSKSFIDNSDKFSTLTSTPSGKLDGFGITLTEVQGTFAFLSSLDSGVFRKTIFDRDFSKPNPQAIALMETKYSPAVLDAGKGLPTLPGPITFEPSRGAGGGPGSAAGGGGYPSGTDAGSPQGLATGSDAGTSDGAATGGADGDQLADPANPDADGGTDPAGGGPVDGRSANDAAISQAGLSPSTDGAQTAGASGQSGRGGAVGGPGGTGAGAVPMAGPMGGGSTGGSTGRSAAGSSGGRGISGGGGIGGRSSGSPALGSLGGSPAAPGKGGLPRGAGMGAAGEGGTNNTMAGRRGMGGGMMGGGGRGGGQEDEAYSPAEFLTTIDNGDKLIGPLPRVVHPVIGAWDDR